MLYIGQHIIITTLQNIYDFISDVMAVIFVAAIEASKSNLIKVIHLRDSSTCGSGDCGNKLEIPTEFDEHFALSASYDGTKLAVLKYRNFSFSDPDDLTDGEQFLRVYQKDGGNNGWFYATGDTTLQPNNIFEIPQSPSGFGFGNHVALSGDGNRCLYNSCTII